MIKRLHFLFVNHTWIHPLLFILLTGVILYLSLLPSDSISPNLIWSYDKLGHGLAFGAWTVSFALILTYTFGKNPSFIILLIPGLAFGILTEVLQHYLPINRYFELLDLAADLTGIVLAIFLIIVVRKRLNSKRNRTTTTA